LGSHHFSWWKKYLQSPRKSFQKVQKAIQEAVFDILVPIAALVGISVVIWAMFLYQIAMIGQMI
jgi:hypothetical protein